MNEETSRIRRLAAAMWAGSPIDRAAHVERIAAVLRRVAPTSDPDLESDLLNEARDASRPVPEQEESL